MTRNRLSFNFPVVLLLFQVVLLIVSQLHQKASAQDWLVSRADAGSSGFAPGKLPKEPKLLWEKSWDKSGFEGTPVIADGKCWLADVEGNVYCLSLADGAEVWKQSFKNGFVASLALREGKLVLGDYDGHVYCLDAKDGKVLWEADVMQAMASGANFYEDLVLISSEGGVLFAFKLLDGSKVWEYSTGDQLRSAPTIWNQTAKGMACLWKDQAVRLRRLLVRLRWYQRNLVRCSRTTFQAMRKSGVLPTLRKPKRFDRVLRFL
ncbi:MAG: PQQ-binding-like beta-propeller repeat protein [Planctomycetaceae bacterium]|nr:PQQ-binding-like beta-propeller repeat protein [Planctomycetaceae bacterium]